MFSTVSTERHYIITVKPWIFVRPWKKPHVGRVYSHSRIICWLQFPVSIYLPYGKLSLWLYMADFPCWRHLAPGFEVRGYPKTHLILLEIRRSCPVEFTGNDPQVRRLSGYQPEKIITSEKFRSEVQLIVFKNAVVFKISIKMYTCKSRSHYTQCVSFSPVQNMQFVHFCRGKTIVYV